MGLLRRLKRAVGAASAAAAVPAPGPRPDARVRAGTWLTDSLWREWEAPLSVVAGESHHQPALRSIAGEARPGGWLVPCEATLVREPENPYDSDAIAVLIEGHKVGHIAADACGELADSLDELGPRAAMAGVPALVRGGWPTRPHLGVMLWLQLDEIRESLPDIDWESLVEEYACAGWPPRNDEGVARSAQEPTRTGRRGEAHPPVTTEPRMPPITGHFSDYVEDVKQLKRLDRLDDAQVLLSALIEAVEEEGRRNGVGVAPWYYEQAAIVCRKRKDLDGEVAVLERFAAQPHAPGASVRTLQMRLEAAKRRREGT